MSIPLVQENSVDAINTSLIAIRNQMGNGGSNMSDVNVNVDVNYNVADTVERGNSLPVTSNGVANCLSYSIQEKFTGKYWIDGKPIYRKCYDAGSYVSNIDWDVTSLNIDVLINSQVIGCNSADGTSTKWTMSLASGIDSRQAYLSFGHFITSGDYYKRYAIIEYTKTT